MTELEEERLAELIAVLPPAPPAWVEAATELPHARAAIEELAARAAADRDARATMLADLEQALRDVGVELRPPLRDRLRVRLSGLE